ncbi:unnamed protein product [Protopolystoma xenopodis]|uniref:Uncharacterized protein n=1 Tax=Protopolystoma xenopodis TaxID=117903 RepID=A0A448WVE0_9PLAT|nr:unnamed protein product [Protopolystoma xenopodis]
MSHSGVMSKPDNPTFFGCPSERLTLSRSLRRLYWPDVSSIIFMFSWQHYLYYNFFSFKDFGFIYRVALRPNSSNPLPLTPPSRHPRQPFLLLSRSFVLILFRSLSPTFAYFRLPSIS